MGWRSYIRLRVGATTNLCLIKAYVHPPPDTGARSNDTRSGEPWPRGAYPACRTKSSNESWFLAQQARSVWSISSLWFIWSIWLVWFNQTDETDQTDQMNKTDWRTVSASCYTTRLTPPSPGRRTRGRERVPYRPDRLCSFRISRRGPDLPVSRPSA